MESQIERQDLEIQQKPGSFTLPRSLFYLFLFLSLFLPIIGLACYAAEVKGIFLVALLSLLLSGGTVWFLLRTWELKMQRSVSKLVKMRLVQSMVSSSSDEIAHLKKELIESRRGYEHQVDLLQSSVAKSKEEVRLLNLEMDKKLEQMRIAYLEFEDLRKEYHRLEEDHIHAREESQKQLKHKESLINEYQRTITEQRMILEKKQRYIGKLENKVNDLMYEIRSLLQLEDVPLDTPQISADDYFSPSAHASTPFDLSIQLQRFIEKAENQTGMDHLGGKSPRFLDLTDSYAVDRRPLFDSFRDENIGIIFILSIKENKILFANQHVKVALGWSPEKFIKEFPKLVTKGYAEWRKALANIAQTKQFRAQMVIQCKTGNQREMTCVMGLITKGPFINHIIGLLS